MTDVNGVSAFLQVIAVASGEASEGDDTVSSDAEDSDGVDDVKTVILWIPAAVALLLLFPAYWLGRRSQLTSLHNKMLKERDEYEKKAKEALAVDKSEKPKEKS